MIRFYYGIMGQMKKNPNTINNDVYLTTTEAAKDHFDLEKK